MNEVSKGILKEAVHDGTKNHKDESEATINQIKKVIYSKWFGIFQVTGLIDSEIFEEALYDAAHPISKGFLYIYSMESFLP